MSTTVIVGGCSRLGLVYIELCVRVHWFVCGTTTCGRWVYGACAMALTLVLVITSKMYVYVWHARILKKYWTHVCIHRMLVWIFYSIDINGKPHNLFEHIIESKFKLSLNLGWTQKVAKLCPTFSWQRSDQGWLCEVILCNELMVGAEKVSFFWLVPLGITSYLNFNLKNHKELLSNCLFSNWIGIMISSGSTK